MRTLEQLLRPNILALQPYSSARDEFSGSAEVYLDANENPFGKGLNRYPDPQQSQLKQALADWRGLAPEQIFLGNGSDEAIDLLLRAFCRPGQDRIIVCPPTYGMYAVSAGIQDAEVVQIPLTPDFQPDLPALEAQFSIPENKLLFLCSPNNPTGNLMDRETILTLLARFPGIVVVDEAYIDFAPKASLLPLLEQYPNLVVLQTFSKAWGLAGIRLGAAFASPALVRILDRIKPPYNLSLLSQERGIAALHDPEEMQTQRDQLIKNRTRLRQALSALPQVVQVFPSDANFLLTRFQDASTTFQALLAAGIIVRDRSAQVAGCLRLTVGTAAENQQLLTTLRTLETSSSKS